MRYKDSRDLVCNKRFLLLGSCMILILATVETRDGLVYGDLGPDTLERSPEE